MIWRLLKYTSYITLAAILLLACFMFVLMPSRSTRFLSVQSGSMVPAIEKGDLVVVKSAPHYQVGDVITFISPRDQNVTITHRVVQLSSAETGNRLVTKGDANAKADTPIAPNAVVGKVNQRVPLAGYAVDFVLQPLGLLMIIYVPALLIIIRELKLLTRHYKSLQPYRILERQRRREPTGQERFAAGAKFSVCFAIIILALAVPARAALMSQATLTGNTITALAPAAASQILIQKVKFDSHTHSRHKHSKHLKIKLYNPTDNDIKIHRWYIKSSHGRLIKFHGGKTLRAHDHYEIEKHLDEHVHYKGDFLALFDKNGDLIDAISWGKDTTYLDPALPKAKPGITFCRIDKNIDTDSAKDWEALNHKKRKHKGHHR